MKGATNSLKEIIIIDPYVFDFLAAEFQNILNWG